MRSLCHYPEIPASKRSIFAPPMTFFNFLIDFLFLSIFLFRHEFLHTKVLIIFHLMIKSKFLEFRREKKRKCRIFDKFVSIRNTQVLLEDAKRFDKKYVGHLAHKHVKYAAVDEKQTGG